MKFHISGEWMQRLEAATKELYKRLDSLGFYVLPGDEQTKLIKNALRISMADTNSGTKGEGE